MKIEVNKFGKMLISRPAGKEAFLAAKAYLFPEVSGDEIVFDFSGVEVLSPSWADEFITGIKDLYSNKNLMFIHTENESVAETLKILGY